ncbi:MAG: Ig-like domain repeat protein, partial [Chloroflexi bacterium]|nr:Ig-like domain repeat protein [Chloroflexota bacterium]
MNGTPFACPSGQTTCAIPLPEGSGLASYKVDSATGLSASGSTFFYLDVTTPQISGSVNGSIGTTGWYISQTTFTASTSDALSGIATFEMNVDNNGWTSYSDTTFTDGIHSIQYRATDNAGNFTETTSQEIKVDTVAPALNLSTTGTTGQNGWYVSTVTLTPTASDSGSGLVALEASIDGAPFTNYQSPITLLDGIHSVQFRAIDNAGNISQTVLQEIKVDTVTPGLSLAANGTIGSNGWYVSNVAVTPNALDAGSGINTIEAMIDGGTWSLVNSPLSFSEGMHTYQIKVTDQAGNETVT